MDSPATIQNLELVFENVVRVIIALGGMGFFVMLLTGGFKYLTSGGDPKAVDGAKNTLSYAVGGLLLLAFAFLILQIVGTLTGTTDNVTNFRIFKP